MGDDVVSRPSIDDSYLAIKQQIGKKHRLPLGRVSQMQCERFAVAAGESAGDEAKGVSAKGVVATPLFLPAIVGWGIGPRNDELRQDGTEAERNDSLSLEGFRIMGAGQDLEFHADVEAGVQVVTEIELESVELKCGHSGKLLVISLLRRYFDLDGRQLVSCRETLIAR